MAQEIERKFLVSGPFKDEASKATRITQGYLSSVPERTVRVRIKGDRGFITIKGIGNASGASRYEWEKEIPVAEGGGTAPHLRAGRHRQDAIPGPGR
jgi:adenylate cyclase